MCERDGVGRAEDISAKGKCVGAYSEERERESEETVIDNVTKERSQIRNEKRGDWRHFEMREADSEREKQRWGVEKEC